MTWQTLTVTLTQILKSSHRLNGFKVALNERCVLGLCPVETEWIEA